MSSQGNSHRHNSRNSAKNSNHQNHQKQQQQPPPQQSQSTSSGNSSRTQSTGSRVISSSTDSNEDTTQNFPFCEDVEKYEKIGKIGQGTFGEVFKGRHTQTKKLVALKKVLMENEKEGFPITALREIKILQLLKHENVVNLIEICRTSSPTAVSNYKATFYLVFDFCEHDLAGLLSNPSVKFSLGEIKKVMQQLLNGLYFIHKQKILHRDMKAANILITKAGVLKLADFGLARAFSEIQTDSLKKYTNRVVTLWYRPPELLLGASKYGPPIDLWGAGCIMAELWTRVPILKGDTEQGQLTLIMELCGSITPIVWPGVEKLPLYTNLKLERGRNRILKERLRESIKCALALDLLDKLLILDPAKRCDSDSALNHDFFWSDPPPTDLGIMLSHINSSMFEFTTARMRQQTQMQNQLGHAGPSGQRGGPFPPHQGGHHQGGGRRGGGGAAGGQYMDRVF